MRNWRSELGSQEGKINKVAKGKQVNKSSELIASLRLSAQSQP